MGQKLEQLRQTTVKRTKTCVLGKDCQNAPEGFIEVRIRERGTRDGVSRSGETVVSISRAGCDTHLAAAYKKIEAIVKGGV